MTRLALAWCSTLLALLFLGFACAGYYAYVAHGEQAMSILVGSGFWAVLGLILGAVGIRLFRRRPRA
jgi:heme/copper-type cytochrome/quinol oxidase subunit 3